MSTEIIIGIGVAAAGVIATTVMAGLAALRFAYELGKDVGRATAPEDQEKPPSS